MTFPEPTPYLLAFIITLAMSLVLLGTKRWHGRFSMDGTEGVQKFHVNPTPRIGGVALAVGLLVTLDTLDAPEQNILQPMLIAGIPAFAMGLIEDITKKAGVLPRLLATMVSGVLAWWLTDIAMRNTGVWGLDELLALTPVAVAFTAFAVGGVANAVNIIDGFNGLAVGAVAIMLGAMGFIALEVGDAPLANVAFVLAAAALGFGALNWPLGKLFLGDGGAYLLGFLLGWIAVLLPMRNPSLNAWVSLLACAYPVLEVAFSYRRKSRREGHHPGQPDRVHFHMLLHRRIAKPIFSKFSRRIQNGMTSPFAWLYAALPAAWAIIFYQSTTALVTGFVIAIFIYAVVYFKLTQFHWNFLPFTYTSKQRDRPHGI